MIKVLCAAALPALLAVPALAASVTYEFSGQFAQHIDLTVPGYGAPTQPGGTFSGQFTVETDEALPETNRVTGISAWSISVQFLATTQTAEFTSVFETGDSGTGLPGAAYTYIGSEGHKLEFRTSATGSCGAYDDSYLQLGAATNQYLGVHDTIELAAKNNEWSYFCYAFGGPPAAFQTPLGTQSSLGLTFTATRVTDGGGDDNPVVPLPAAAWMLLSGFGALAAAGRRRRGAA